MLRQPLRGFPLAWALIGAALPHPARAQGEAAGTGPSYVLVAKSAKRIKAGLTVEVKAPNLQADEWSVYVAQIPELPGQVEVRTTLSPRGKPVRELSDEGRPLLVARVPAAGRQWRQDVTVLAEYEATLVERRLERREPGGPAAPAVAPLDPKARRLGLAGGHQFDYQAGPFRAWLDERGLRRGDKEGEVEFARRAFVAVRTGIKHFEGAGVEHLASRACAAGKSDYAGITAVYVAALRANGIPARALGGRVVISEGRPTGTGWAHAKVEFYAGGIGWVPADVAGAVRFNRSPEGLESFGNDTAEFLTTHLDTDLIIKHYFGKETLAWLPDAAWWVKGSGTYDGGQTKVTGTVVVEPRDLSEVLARKPARPGTKPPAATPPRPAR